MTQTTNQNKSCPRCGVPMVRGMCSEICEIHKYYDGMLAKQEIKLKEVLARIKILENEINENREFIRDAGESEMRTITRLVKHNTKMDEALCLIAAPMRPDGTWNRDRAACRDLARKALGIK